MPLYEAHLPVSDLAASVAFYRDALGLIPAFEQPQRGVTFLHIDSRETGMICLWAPGSMLGWKPRKTYRGHFALSVLYGWQEGDEAHAVLPKLPESEHQRLGMEAGRRLRQMHTPCRRLSMTHEG